MDDDELWARWTPPSKMGSGWSFFPFFVFFRWFFYFCVCVFRCFSVFLDVFSVCFSFLFCWYAFLEGDFRLMVFVLLGPKGYVAVCFEPPGHLPRPSKRV